MIGRPAGRWLADRIPGAKCVEFEGEDHSCWVMPNWRALVDCSIEFLTGTAPGPRVERRFATILFTDIVDSTRQCAEVGDETWRSMLDRHDRTAWTAGIEIRAGLHAREIEVREHGDVAGLAVNLAGRVEEVATAGSICVSSTVRDLLLGSAMSFEDRGEQALKGIDGVWHLYELAS